MFALPCSVENKENSRSYVIKDDNEDSNDGKVLYREEYDDEKSKFVQCC